MLTYVFKALKQDEYKTISGEKFDNIHSLLAAILSKGIAHQIKRGLHRDYVEVNEELSTLRGKINILPSARLINMGKNKLDCTHDEYSVNSTLNRILKTTMILLIRNKKVDDLYRNELKRMLPYFTEVEEIQVSEIRWKALKFERNNESYRMLINICYFVIAGLLLNTEKGSHKMASFLFEKEMHTLYEHFILAYYSYHYNGVLDAKAPKIEWLTDDDKKPLLPEMHTDITLYDKKSDKKLIIDAKYYSKIFTSTQYNKETLRSAHLYQIFAYVQNEDKYNEGNVGGMLLYAKTDDECFEDKYDFTIKGNAISARTLDLSLEFHSKDPTVETIRKNLDRIVFEFFGIQPTQAIKV